MRIEQRHRRRVATPLLSILCLLLCGALVWETLSYSNFRDEVRAAATQPEPEAPGEEPDSIPLDFFKQRAQQFNLSTEFLQGFFDDAILYKDKSGIVYAPIDPKLPKNSYDWSNLVWTNGRVDYVENGVSKALAGIDVSKYQGEIDWDKVKADGIDFAFIRYGSRGWGTGKLVEDELFHKNMQNARRAGVEVGVYFYTQAVSAEEAVEEANAVVQALQGYKVSFPVVLDTEEVHEGDSRTNELSSEEMTAAALAFCDTVAAAGYRPMIYAGTKWFVSRLELERLTKYDLWLAQYYKTPFFPYDFQIWQYTGSGKVDGIQGDVDLNLCFVNYAPKSIEAAGVPAAK